MLDICRICLLNVENCLKIKTNLADMIMSFASIEIKNDDGLPQQICSLCCNNAQIAYNFKLMCEKSDIELKLKFLKNEVNSEKEPELDKDTELEQKILENIDVEGDTHLETEDCQPSGKTFITEPKLLAHSKSHSRIKKTHLCQICGKEFTLPENLRRHQRIHLGVKPYVCNLCDKSFIQSNELKSHIVSHTTEKSHLCSYCGKKFARNNSLKLHIRRLHRNAKEEFVCSFCGKSFKDRVDIAMHKLVHGEKKHTCATCNKSFSRKSNLKAHERTHSQTKPFMCHLCSKGFIRKSVLTEHLNSHPNTNDV